MTYDLQFLVLAIIPGPPSLPCPYSSLLQTTLRGGLQPSDQGSHNRQQGQSFTANDSRGSTIIIITALIRRFLRAVIIIAVVIVRTRLGRIISIRGACRIAAIDGETPHNVSGCINDTGLVGVTVRKPRRAACVTGGHAAHVVSHAALGANHWAGMAIPRYYKVLSVRAESR